MPSMTPRTLTAIIRSRSSMSSMDRRRYTAALFTQYVEWAGLRLRRLHRVHRLRLLRDITPDLIIDIFNLAGEGDQVALGHDRASHQCETPPRGARLAGAAQALQSWRTLVQDRDAKIADSVSVGKALVTEEDR